MVKIINNNNGVGGGIISDGNVNIDTQPILTDSVVDINLQTTESETEGDTTIRVSNFTSNDVITLFGDYPQNYVDIPKFDLSEIIVINEYIANFNFIVSLFTEFLLKSKYDFFI